MTQYFIIHHSATPRDATNLAALRADHKIRFGRTFYQKLITPYSVENEHDILNDRGNGNVSKDICVICDASIDNPYFQQRYDLGRILGQWLRNGNDPTKVIGHTEITALGLLGEASSCPARLMQQIATWPREKLALNVCAIALDDSDEIDLVKLEKEVADYYFPWLRVKFVDTEKLNIKPVWESTAAGASLDWSWAQRVIAPYVPDGVDIVQLFIKGAWYQPTIHAGKAENSKFFKDRALLNIVRSYGNRMDWIGTKVNLLTTSRLAIHEISHNLHGIISLKGDYFDRQTLHDPTHDNGDDYLLGLELLTAVKKFLSKTDYIPGSLNIPIPIPQPTPTQNKLIETLVSIRRVFGPTWNPAPKVAALGLPEKGKLGYVRVVGSKKPYNVYSIGWNGTKETALSYFLTFKSTNQDGIVGEINVWQAKLLGITDADAQSA